MPTQRDPWDHVPLIADVDLATTPLAVVEVMAALDRVFMQVDLAWDPSGRVLSLTGIRADVDAHDALTLARYFARIAAARRAETAR